MDDKDEREIIIEKYRRGRDKLDKTEINAWEDPDFDIYHATDRYGFVHGERLPDRLPDYENKIKNQENSRLNKWLKMLKTWDQYFPDNEKLRSRTYKGIPNALRGEVWGRLLSINTLKQEQSGKYQEMLEYGILHSRDVRQIDLDVNRTYRNHIMFRERYNTKQQMLFRVLVAYSVYNSEVGYCQGMSQIAALLLMYMDEEDAFWSVSALMSDERHAMHGFFIPGFPKLLRFAKHHDKIIQKFLPKVWKHFKKYDIDSTLYTLKWFFQCFLDRVPFSLTLRLWDVFLLDGEVILTGMSYTLLKLHKRTLLRKSMEETIEFLQIELEKDFGYHDDSAVQALQTSIADLRKYKMLNAEKPGENEFPSRPFGYLALEKLGHLSDDHSIAGSVKLKVNDTSSVATSRGTSEAGSQTDLRCDDGEENEEEKEGADQLRASLSLYDNVSLTESIEAAKQQQHQQHRQSSRLSNYSSSKKSSSEALAASAASPSSGGRSHHSSSQHTKSPSSRSSSPVVVGGGGHHHHQHRLQATSSPEPRTPTPTASDLAAVDNQQSSSPLPSSSSVLGSGEVVDAHRSSSSPLVDETTATTTSRLNNSSPKSNKNKHNTSPHHPHYYHHHHHQNYSSSSPATTSSPTNSSASRVVEKMIINNSSSSSSGGGNKQEEKQQVYSSKCEVVVNNYQAHRQSSPSPPPPITADNHHHHYPNGNSNGNGHGGPVAVAASESIHSSSPSSHHHQHHHHRHHQHQHYEHHHHHSETIIVEDTVASNSNNTSSGGGGASKKHHKFVQKKLQKSFSGEGGGGGGGLVDHSSNSQLTYISINSSSTEEKVVVVNSSSSSSSHNHHSPPLINSSENNQVRIFSSHQGGLGEGISTTTNATNSQTSPSKIRIFVPYNSSSNSSNSNSTSKVVVDVVEQPPPPSSPLGSQDLPAVET